MSDWLLHLSTQTDHPGSYSNDPSPTWLHEASLESSRIQNRHLHVIGYSQLQMRTTPRRAHRPLRRILFLYFDTAFLLRDNNVLLSSCQSRFDDRVPASPGIDAPDWVADVVYWRLYVVTYLVHSLIRFSGVMSPVTSASKVQQTPESRLTEECCRPWTRYSSRYTRIYPNFEGRRRIVSMVATAINKRDGSSMEQSGTNVHDTMVVLARSGCFRGSASHVLR